MMEAASQAVELGDEPDFRLGRLMARPSCCVLQCGNESYSVEPRVMQVLVALAQRKDSVVTREQLVRRCWGGRIVSEDAINRALAKLRRLADLDCGESFQVETIPRVGFRLVEKHCGAGVLKGAPEVEARTTRLTGQLWQLKAFGVLAACLLLALLSLFILRYVVPTNVWSSAENLVLPMPHSVGASKLPSGAVFRDCAIGCPEMVIIPDGYFAMGSAHSSSIGLSEDYLKTNDNESPQHEVLIRKPFALARYDVTREEFARFVSDTKRPLPDSCFTLTSEGTLVETVGANWQHPGFGQTQRDPAVCINWDDAVAYTKWLSRRTGKTYRLPTEAEWEYAARAISLANVNEVGSAGVACGAQNGADADYHLQYPGDPRYDPDCHDGYANTSPVGQYPANAFGLFDMEGNVVQWTEDCYHPTYDHAPVDGSAWLEPKCAARVVRGGYWASDSRSNRFARRGGGGGDARVSGNGFRVARDL